MERGRSGIIIDRVLNTVLLVSFVVFLSVFIIGNLVLPNEKDYSPSSVVHFSEGWKIRRNGELRSIQIPANVHDSDNPLIIENTLPEITKGELLSIRSSQQNARFYVDGILRGEYHTPYGKNSASRFLFWKLDEKDSGKSVRIELSSSSIYSGTVNEIFLGTEVDIWYYYISKFVVNDLFALFMVCMGLFSLVFSLFLKLAYSRNNVLVYYGLEAVLTGLWRLSESRIRQLYFHNNSFTSSMAFVLMLMMATMLPFFMNSIQRNRYRRLWRVMETLTFLQLAISCTIALLGIYDFVEMLPAILLLSLLLLLTSLSTILRDIKKGYWKVYRYTAYGMMILVILMIAEIYLVYFASWYTQQQGLLMFTGLFILMFCTLYQEVRDLVINLNEKDRKEKEHEQLLNKQVIMALTATVDAKDRYTKGHSTRVAEYSREIAKRAGMSDREVNKVYYMALLHDVGKISIPDYIINRPGRISEEEYEIVKNHTLSGSEILRNIKEMPDIYKGALYHHERWDGTGYPHQLKGEEIPVEARIIAVADSYDAMTSFRHYRDVLSQVRVRTEIMKNRGTQFDPRFADIMLKMIEEDRWFRMREMQD